MQARNYQKPDFNNEVLRQFSPNKYKYIQSLPGCHLEMTYVKEGNTDKTFFIEFVY